MKKIALDSIFLRIVNPARLPYPSEVIASLGLSSQFSSPTLQFFPVRIFRRERTDVIAEIAVPKMTDPRASPIELLEKSASSANVCNPREAGSLIIALP